MIGRLWSRWAARREARALARRAIPDALWDAVLARYPFLARLSEADRAELRRLSSLFLDSKEFTGAQGFTVTDDVAVSVAAQACLPVLRLGLGGYEGFVGIVIHPDEVLARRSVTDEAGVVHEYDEPLSGEAMEHGPVMLSWRDVDDAGQTADDAYNVVIHEFVHVLDMADGMADGVPGIADAAAHQAWVRTMDAEYAAFCDLVDCGRETLLDPYGAHGPDEFFAVAAEAFFVAPRRFVAEHPRLYAAFRDWFRQDPAAL